MLLQLRPKDITKHWEGISEAISKSLPPITTASAERMTFILRSLLVEVMQCWVLCKPNVGKDTTDIYAIATTEYAIDPGSGTRNLLIFSLYSLQKIPQELWKDGYETLQKFAKANNCESIIAFTDVPAVIHLVEGFGGNVATRLLIMGLDNE